MKRRNFENKKFKKLFVFGHTFKGDGPVVPVSQYIRNNYNMHTLDRSVLEIII